MKFFLSELFLRACTGTNEGGGVCVLCYSMTIAATFTSFMAALLIPGALK